MKNQLAEMLKTTTFGVNNITLADKLKEDAIDELAVNLAERGVKVEDKPIVTMNNKSTWFRYIEYLHKWADSHSGTAFAGMSPVSYDEWLSCEFEEEETPEQTTSQKFANRFIDGNFFDE